VQAALGVERRSRSLLTEVTLFQGGGSPPASGSGASGEEANESTSLPWESLAQGHPDRHQERGGDHQVHGYGFAPALAAVLAASQAS
jgi:hypothetical protein